MKALRPLNRLSAVAAALCLATTSLAMAQLDTTPPSAAITSPVPASTLSGRTLGTISGTAADDIGVASVELKIARVSDGKFWDGVAGWSATAVVLPASFDVGLGTWTATGQTPWLVAGDYTITVTAKDAAGNATPASATVTMPLPAAAFISGNLVIPNAATQVQSSGLSWDGSKLVGAALTTGSIYKRAFRWSEAGGFETLADLTGGTAYSEPYAMSADGGMMVGFASSTDSVLLDGAGVEAARWTGPATVAGIGDISHVVTGDPFNSRLFAVSANGAVAAGFGSYKHTDNTTRLMPVRWTAGGGFEELGDLPGGGLSGDSRGVSGDGSIVVGYSNAAPDVIGTSRAQGFRWTQATGIEGLPDAAKSFPGPAVDRKSVAYGISADGSTIVGYFSEGRESTIVSGNVVERRTHAVRWTAAGAEKLGQLTYSTYYSIARAVSGDGKVVVGMASLGSGVYDAFIWREGMGIFSIKGLLAPRFDMSKIELTDATAVSADGYTVTGKGNGPFGEFIWVATLPPVPLLPPDPVVPPGEMLTATATFTPKITFAETYVESVKTTTESFDGETSTFREVVGAGTNSATLVASMAGINLTTIDGSTEVQVVIGSFIHNATLEEDSTYLKGKASATFKLMGLNALGNEISIGTVKYAWTTKTLTVTITCSNSSQFPIAYSDFTGLVSGGEPGSNSAVVNATLEASVGFAGVGGLCDKVYITGKVTGSTRTFGSGETAEPFDLVSVTIAGNADFAAPVVAFTAPAANLRTTAAMVNVTGTVKDPHLGEKVFVRINGGAFTEITPTIPEGAASVSWQLADVALVAGPNLIEAKSTDASGNESLLVSRKVTRIVMTPLAVSHLGIGTVTAKFEPTSSREIGASYTITATPGKGYVFDGWTGIVGSEPKLTFTMTEGLTLVAHFIPTPFPAIAGDYRGLVTSSNPSVLAENGAFTLTPTITGTLTFKLSLGAASYTVAGVKLHNDGTASFTLSRGAKLPPLHVTLQVAIDPTDGHVTGTITGGGITATLSGDRTLIDLAHPVPVGTYTLLFPTLLDEPAGANSGSASLVISAKGLVTVIGRLADATSFTATSNISKDGGIPVFAKIGAGLTTLSGVLTFNVSAGAPEGTLRWLHGTDTALAVIGCYYSPPVLNKRVLDTLNATSGAAKVTLSVGGLAAPIVKTVTISTLSRVTVRPIAADKLLITIVPALGTFSGTFVPPGTIKTVPISGIFFEDLNAGLGLFITPTGAVGHVRIEAAP